VIWNANANSTNMHTKILKFAVGFTNVTLQDMWFCGSPDKDVHEFFICNMNTQSRNLRWP